ncbi:MAG TPA: alkaline phosphatase family protein [Candidatus Binatia bacterium]|nr:alkaline phosphatase family protein [Candidatus Binatia bacterium]
MRFGRFTAAVLALWATIGPAVETLHAQTPPKAIVIGWDGALPAFVQEMLRRGKLPNLTKLIQGGVFADDVVAVYPSKTAPGFAALWTGAPPRQTGISGNRQPRGPAHQYTILDNHISFLGAPLRAEPIWAVALRAARKTVLLNVPLGRELSDGAIKVLGYDSYSGRDGVIGSRTVKAQPAVSWHNLPISAKPPMEIQFSIGASSFFGLFVDDPANSQAGYDTLLVTSARDGRTTAARLTTGPGGFQDNFWSGPLEVKASGNESAGVYLRLFDLQPETAAFLLYHTRPARTMIFPSELAASHAAAAGTFVGNGANILYQEGALGPTLAAGGDGGAETRYLETVVMAQRQLTRTALWAMRSVPWDLLLLYTPFPDEGEHVWRGYIDAPANPGNAKLRRLLEEVYETSDDLLGELMFHRPENTVVAVVSDHGMERVDKLVAINRALERAGLLVLNDKGQPDLARTKAFYPPINNGYLLINSTHRKNGIVSQDQRADVISRIRTALMGIKDNGRTVVTELYDAAIADAKMGIGGDTGGDLYIDLLPGYDFDGRTGPGEIVAAQPPLGMHGANPDRPSMRTIMVLNGPGVASGKKLDDVRLIDFAPTLAKLLNLAAPKDSTGRVLQEALTNLH